MSLQIALRANNLVAEVEDSVEPQPTFMRPTPRKSDPEYDRLNSRLCTSKEDHPFSCWQ